MHTPVSVSPASIARSTGAAPRQRGSSEKCTFTKPSGQRFEQRGRAAAGRTRRRRRARRRWPRPRRRPRATSPGVRTARPSSSAAALTGLGSARSPRPRRRSGWVTTRAMSWPAPCSATQRRHRVGGRAEEDEAHERPAIGPVVGASRPSAAVGAVRASSWSRISRSASLRSSGSSRSSSRMPSRWSISCWNTRPRKSSPSSDDLVAVEVEAPQVTRSARTTSKRKPGTERQPSSSIDLAVRARRSRG